MVGDLREGFCRREPNAARNADPPENLGPDVFAVGYVIGGGGRGRVDEGLVYRILLYIDSFLAKNGNDPVRHISVKLVVRRAEGEFAGFLAVLQLEVRRSHRDAESLELVRSGDATSVVVGEDGNWAAYETAVEHAFAGHKEVVAVDKTDHDFGVTGLGEWGAEADLVN